jgi:vitamin B12 transporter
MYSTSTTTLPTPNLKPEKSKSWELGADISWEFMTGSVTYFHSTWKDKIINNKVTTGQLCPSGTDMVLCNEYVNLQGATFSGLELSLSADIGQALNQSFELRPYVNLTRFLTRRNDDHSTSTRSVEAVGSDIFFDISKMTMAYGVNFFEPGIDLAVDLNVSYAGDMLTANLIDGGRTMNSPDSPQFVHNAPGSIVNMVLEKGLWDFQDDKGKLKARLEVNNLLDKYDTNYMHYPGPGRNFYLGLAYEY